MTGCVSICNQSVSQSVARKGRKKERARRQWQMCVIVVVFRLDICVLGCNYIQYVSEAAGRSGFTTKLHCGWNTLLMCTDKMLLFCSFFLNKVELIAWKYIQGALK